MQDDLGTAFQRLRDTEVRADAAAAQLRSDLKQALALSSASSRAEAEAEASGRVKESERRLVARLQSLEEGVEAKVAAVGTRVSMHVSGELDKRLQGLNEHIDFQVKGVTQGDGVGGGRLQGLNEHIDVQVINQHVVPLRAAGSGGLFLHCVKLIPHLL